jgi:hypothetical protein
MALIVFLQNGLTAIPNSGGIARLLVDAARAPAVPGP